jgi:hypothetical protein
MRILAIERELPTAQANHMEEILRVEAACVWDSPKRGIIRDIWFTTAGNNAVIMLEFQCGRGAAAPGDASLVHAGVIEFTVLNCS